MEVDKLIMDKIAKMVCLWNVKLIKLQVYEIAYQQNGKLIQWQVEENCKLLKQQVDKMTSWWNCWSPKWKVGTTTSRKKCKLVKC